MEEKRRQTDEEVDAILLESLIKGPRYLDIGRSPVRAIERAFALASAGKVHIVNGWIYLEPIPKEQTNCFRCGAVFGKDGAGCSQCF